MSQSGEDEYYVVYNIDKQPMHLLLWPANGVDVKIWVNHLLFWAPAWPTALGEIGASGDAGTIDRVTDASAIESLKSQVSEVSTQHLTAWSIAAESTRPPRADEHAIKIYAQVLNGMKKGDSQFVDHEGFGDLWDSIAADIAETRRTNPDASFGVPNE